MPTTPRPADHPFRASIGGVWIDCVSRLDRVKEMGPEQLRRVLELPPDDLQKTVRIAAERRLRKLEKEAKRG